MNKQKTILTFILLKVFEIGSIFGLTLGIYYLGKFFGNKSAFTEYYLKEGIIGIWISGFLILISILLTIFLISMAMYLLGYIIYEFIKLNWKWAIMLNETQEERIEREKKEKKIKDDKNINEYGFTEGDYVRIRDDKILNPDDESYIKLQIARDKKKSFKVNKISWISIHLDGLEESKYLNNNSFVLVKKGERR